MEDRINLHQLMELKAAFDRADTDGGGSLDMDEFLTAFGAVLGKNLSHEQLMHLFMKIDANSDGSIDWDEFTNFMLLENQAASDMSDRSYSVRLSENSPPDPNPKHHAHTNMMDGILQLPKLDRLFTNSRDGTVRVWHAQNFTHLKTLKVSESWVTGMCHFEHSNRVAASSIDRTISFFDAVSYELVSQLTGLEASPLCLASWNDQDAERILVGDDCGSVALYETLRKGVSEASMSAASFRRGEDKGRHSDWVTKVQYYSDLNLMISSSLDGTLKIGELEALYSRSPSKTGYSGTERRAATTRVLGDVNSAHREKRGVYTFTWSSTCKQLASCGLDRAISLWNPYTRGSKPLAVLQGHTSSVLHVAINDNSFQLVSCSLDKCFKVWDLRSHKCLQTVHDTVKYRPEDRITAMAFDAIHSRLLTGTTKLRVWPMVKMAQRSAKPKHEHPLCAALYNKNFNQIVSGDESAQVCVWDLSNGELVFHFSELHANKMTAMTFDEAGRRLVTGANDGTTRVWNFSNGQCLQELNNESKLEVSCLAFVVEGQNKYTVAGGWNRRVLVWRDEATSSSAPVEPDRVMIGHDEDILSIAYSPPNLLATSGYDGKLCVWNMDSGILKYSLTTPGASDLAIDGRAMWKLIFLEKRTQALVSGSADGKLRFWNVKEGCLVWEHATHHKQKEVVALATEATNSFVFSGDADGYLKVWDIHKFLNVVGLDQRGHVFEIAHWKAHDGCIVSLDYVERHRLILTASTDTRIKLWHIAGGGVLLAGVVGEQYGPTWNIADPSTYEPVELVLPDHPAVSSLAGAARALTQDTAARAAPEASEDEDEDEEEEEEDFQDSRRYGGSNVMPQSDTSAMINKILAGRATRKSGVTPNFRSLRTHDLAEVSPRGAGGATPR